MPPRKRGKDESKVASSSKAVAKQPSTPVIFPEIQEKEHLECYSVLEDQILIVDDFLSPQECKEYVKFIDSLPLELTPPKKRGEAERVNRMPYLIAHGTRLVLISELERFSVISLDFAQKLHKRLTPHLPSFPYPTSLPSRKASQTEIEGVRHPHSFNSNIRVYKYAPGQYFGPHYDDSVKDALTGATSEWTLLVYLTGEEDGIEGGQTLFYRDQKGKPRETITPPLKRGSALLHRHGFECMLHEGAPVLKGTKYVLRSDLMFMR